MQYHLKIDSGKTKNSVAAVVACTRTANNIELIT